MKVRADQVRAGYNLRGATVTRVRPSLDRGTIRITVENPLRRTAPTISDGTFCYLTDDILDIDEARRPGPPAQRTE